ncbi:hypothetical protein, partial [Phocaeicola plebeius]|uniref:hypothetical protein n=1 Tax=Phocaeicola plebeius TaxID=310297 RepID=UPI0026EC9B40
LYIMHPKSFVSNFWGAVQGKSGLCHKKEGMHFDTPSPYSGLFTIEKRQGETVITIYIQI